MSEQDGMSGRSRLACMGQVPALPAQGNAGWHGDPGLPAWSEPARQSKTGCRGDPALPARGKTGWQGDPALPARGKTGWHGDPA